MQMSAVMAMAAAGIGGCGMNSGFSGGMPPVLPGTGSAQFPGTAPPPMDPGIAAQAYSAMFTQFYQQAQAAQAAQAAHYAAQVPQMPFPPAAPYDSGNNGVLPAISVSVEGMKFQYQLTEDDLQKVFSRYGSVTRISVDEAGTTAEITFQDFLQAQAAMQDLNGKVLNGLDGTLRLNWVTGTVPQSQPYNPYWNMPPPVMPGFPAASPLPGLPGPGHGDISSILAMAGAPAAVPVAAPVPPRLPDGYAVGSVMPAANDSGIGLADTSFDKSGAPAHVKGVRKYTCRYLIGIENDKDFQVVRRIIGAKGANMKKIVKPTEAKLRLRGVGSGYFEGAGQKESSEPLQLCVSCTSSEGYRMAQKLVEELLEGVYAEYRQFCRESGKPELDLHPSPQNVSQGGGRGRGAQGPVDDDDEDDDDGADGDSPDKRNRRRGRRARKGGEDLKLGEKGEPPPKAPTVDEIEKFIDQRNEARRQCNFQ